MASSTLPVIVGVYLAMAALLLWLLSGGRMPFWARLALVVATPLLSFAIWSAVGTPSGWPTRAAPPARALFIWGLAVEPDAEQAGAIYLWLLPEPTHGIFTLGYRPGVGEPRLYRAPYSRDLHEQLQEAMGEVGRGRAVEVRRVRAGRHGDARLPRSALRFYRLPPPHLPGKLTRAR